MPTELRLRAVQGLILLATGVSGTAAPLGAQNPEPAPPSRVEATRAELEAIAAHPPKGMSPANLASVQSRLAVGDFAVGDKLWIEVVGDPTFTDTFTVRTGRTLSLPELPPLSLEGVLRSESDSVVTTFLGKYLKSPQVTVTPLIRLGILGGVIRPGYYDVAAQSLLSELVMNAGGLSGVGDMKRSKVLRNNDEILDPKGISFAISDGKTLDVLNLQSGDNFTVGRTDTQAALNKIQIVSALLAIPLMIVTLTAIVD